MSTLQILLPMVIILVVLAVLNVPLYLAILGATLYLYVFVINVPLGSLFTGIFDGVSKTSFLCIPFFILTGTLMQASTLGRRLVDLFMVILRSTKAGLAIACLLANAFFGAISGSAPAAVATFGPIIYKPLEEAQGPRLATGLITSSGALSTIIPPSITLIIYGIATETSITNLFIAGFLPGIFIVILVSIYLVYQCNRNIRLGQVNWVKMERTTGKEFLQVFKKSIPVLVLPVIILGSIYTGLATPTEAGAISSVYTAVVAILVLKDIKIKELPNKLGSACRVTGQLFILIACSSVFARAMTMAQLPRMVSEGFSNFDQITFLLMLNILLLIVGCFFDTGAAVLILAPLLLPAALNLGINPIHLGIVFTVNLSIGMFTPPFGLNIFVAQSVLGKKMGEITKSLVPFIIVYIIALVFLTYIPQISLILGQILL